MPIPLEDNFNDIIGKAMRGLKLSEDDVAARAGIPAEQVHKLVEGMFEEGAARKVAHALQLHADALVASATRAWRPEPVKLDGLAHFNTPWSDMTVNSYLVWDTSSGDAVAFDTGADCSPILTDLRNRALDLRAILLTHTHGDHIFDLDRLKSRTNAPAYVSEREPLEGAEPFTEGRAFEIGKLRIETRLTSGHSKGGITFVIHGLTKPVAIVGDSIFAGSMGGGMVSYDDAIKNNVEQILTLPDETILCPGHGPLTTVGEEKRHNPFFAR